MPVPPARQIGNGFEQHFGPDCILKVSQAKLASRDQSTF